MNDQVTRAKPRRRVHDVALKRELVARSLQPGASVSAIALEAGLLFGLLYNVTRSLWLCMGVHAAWNMAQGPFYGIPVSGFEQHGLLASHMQGPEWLTGGAFGAEASVAALCICSMATAVCLAVAIRRGTLVPPPWRRVPQAPVV